MTLVGGLPGWRIGGDLTAPGCRSYNDCQQCTALRSANVTVRTYSHASDSVLVIWDNHEKIILKQVS